MNWLDAVLLLITGGFAASGFYGGFSRTGLGCWAVAAAFLCATCFHPAGVWGFLIVFGGFLLAASAAEFLLARKVRGVGRQWVGGAKGSVLGLLNAMAVTVGVVLALTAFAPAGALDGSKFARYTFDTASRLAIMVQPGTEVSTGPSTNDASHAGSSKTGRRPAGARRRSI